MGMNRDSSILGYSNTVSESRDKSVVSVRMGVSSTSKKESNSVMV